MSPEKGQTVPREDPENIWASPKKIPQSGEKSLRRHLTLTLLGIVNIFCGHLINKYFQSMCLAMFPQGTGQVGQQLQGAYMLTAHNPLRKGVGVRSSTQEGQHPGPPTTGPSIQWIPPCFPETSGFALLIISHITAPDNKSFLRTTVPSDK